jgi:glycosyltransferase involved in cell wall biosynthesis
MRDLRVLHIITRLIVGGAQENTLFTVIGQHATDGIDVTLLSGIDDGPEGNLHDQAMAAGVKLDFLPELVRPIDPRRDAVAFAKLVAYIRAGRFDIVHTHSSKAGILGRMAARAAGTPIVVHTLHSLVFGEHATSRQNALYLRVKRLCVPLTHKYISVCDATRLGAIAAGIGKPEKHRTIYSGFPVRPFLDIRDSLTTAEAKRLAGIDSDALVVGKVARLFPQKGHDYFLEAARGIADVNERAEFLLVGDGTLRDELETRVREMGLASRFHFAGLVSPDEVPRYMQAMDVMVHTSVREGLARVLPQASAVGKPIVGFALDGTPEAIDDGNRGLLATPYDAADVARKTLVLLDDPERRAAMGEAGRQFAAEEFPVEVMVGRVNESYFELARERLPAVSLR